MQIIFNLLADKRKLWKNIGQGYNHTKNCNFIVQKHFKKLTGGLGCVFWLVYLVWGFGRFLIIKWHKKVVKFKTLPATFADLPSHSTLSNPRSIDALRITSTFVICILLVLHCINNWSLYQTSFGRIILSHCRGSVSKHHSQHWLQHFWFNITGISILKEDMGLSWAKFSIQICKSKWCLSLSDHTRFWGKKTMKQWTNEAGAANRAGQSRTKWLNQVLLQEKWIW